jgi:hypothetical protein
LRGIAGALAGAAGLARLGAAAAGDRGPGRACRENANCVAGAQCLAGPNGRKVCTCVGGLQACGDRCVDATTAYQSDVDNCGSCGNRCPQVQCHRRTCTAGVCGSQPNPSAVGTSCTDGNRCTVNDVCQSDGSCAGTAVVCPDQDQCHTGYCDPVDGLCKQQVKTDAACNDGNACTTGETCQVNGTCGGGTSASDGTTCPQGICQSGTCVACVGTYTVSGSNDASACSSAAVCCQDEPTFCEEIDACRTGPQCCHPAGGSCTFDCDCCGSLLCPAGTCQQA